MQRSRRILTGLALFAAPMVVLGVKVLVERL
jgi:hypothetical protein